MLQLILASQSPRRHELLKEAGFEFTVDYVKVSEIIDENVNLDDALRALAQVKAKALIDSGKLAKLKDYLVLGADTVVVLDQVILGKPKNIAEAEQFLTRLSGREHSVKTALSLYHSPAKKFVTALDSTQVEFRNLSESEIKKYVASGEPMDKAGAYAIQGGARDFVSEYRGSWSNVVGLPMELFEKVLNENGWSIGRRKS